MNFKRRIALVMTLSAFVTVAIISLTSVSIARSTLANRTQEFLVTAMRSQAQEINQLLFSAEKAANSIADEILLSLVAQRYLEDSEYRTSYRDSIERAVRLAAEINSSHSAYAVFFDRPNEGDGRHQIWYADLDKNGIPEKQDVNMLEPRLNPTTIIAQAPDPSTITWIVNESSKDLIGVIRPIYLGNQLIGYAGSDVSGSALARQLDRGSYFRSGIMWMMDPSGAIVVHKRLPVADASLSILYKHMKALDDLDFELFNVESTFNGVATSHTGQKKFPLDALSANDDAGGQDGAMDPEKMMATLTLNNGWRLFTSVDQSDVYRGLDRIIFIILGAMTLALTIAGLYSLAMAQRIAQPYSYLADKINAIGQGEYATELGVHYLHRKDEAGTLSRAIEAMKLLQKQNFDTITAYSENLERLVEARTHELSLTNDRLSEALTQTQVKEASLELANQQLEAMLQDIALAKRQLALSEKLASLSKVLIGISHNMNTPLGNAVTLVTFLEEKTVAIHEKLNSRQLTSHELEQYLDDSKSICQRIFGNIGTSRSYIDKITEISKMQSQSPVQFEFASFYLLAEAQFSLVKATHTQVYAVLSSDFEPDENNIMPVNGVSTLLYELMENSFEHAVGEVGFAPGNPLRISLTKLPHARESQFAFRYRDNGIGLPKEGLSEIFTPLYTAKLGTHAGLGLHQVHQLITQVFKGSIEAHLDPRGGLCFDIVLQLELTTLESGQRKGESL